MRKKWGRRWGGKIKVNSTRGWGGSRESGIREGMN